MVYIVDDKLPFRLNGAKELSSAVESNNGYWPHVLTCVGTEGHQLYLDGKLVDSGELSRRTTNSNRLGLDLGPSSGHGTVLFDEVTVFGKVVPLDEVYRLYLDKNRQH